MISWLQPKTPFFGYGITGLKRTNGWGRNLKWKKGATISPPGDDTPLKRGIHNFFGAFGQKIFETRYRKDWAEVTEFRRTTSMMNWPLHNAWFQPLSPWTLVEQRRDEETSRSLRKERDCRPIKFSSFWCLYCCCLLLHPGEGVPSPAF